MLEYFVFMYRKTACVLNSNKLGYSDRIVQLCIQLKVALIAESSIDISAASLR